MILNYSTGPKAFEAPRAPRHCDPRSSRGEAISKLGDCVAHYQKGVFGGMRTWEQ